MPSLILIMTLPDTHTPDQLEFPSELFVTDTPASGLKRELGHKIFHYLQESGYLEYLNPPQIDAMRAEIRDLMDLSGETLNLEILARLIGTRLQLMNAIKMNGYDKKTGLLTANEMVEKFREIADEEPDEVYSVIMMDLDDFKKLNDTHGHAWADQVLGDFGSRVKSCTKPKDLRYRFGGEEVLVLLKGVPLEKAILIAERLRSAIASRPFIAEDSSSENGIRTIPYTVSIGVAEGTGKDFSRRDISASIVEKADSELRKSKREGKNKVSAALLDSLK